MEKNRIKYLDIAKFIGIFCIYLGHFANAAGRAYHFVFTFHVPLFFFLSGCTETLMSDIPWHKYIKKNIKSLLIPWLFFALAALLLNCILTDTHTNIVPQLINILKGCIRNQYIAGSLWFLTCLFVIRIAFYFLRKLLKYKLLIIIVCFCLFVISEKDINPRPIVSPPSMVYNIDSACYYIIFYALGYCCFDKIRHLLALDASYKKIICACLGFVCLIYSGLLFWGRNLLNYINTNAFMGLICSLLCPMITICLVLIVSKFLENVKLFNELGSNTLFLCGSEYIIKLLVPSCIQIVGLDISLSNPVVTYLYTFALLIVCNKTLIPLEKTIFRKFHLLK